MNVRRFRVSRAQLEWILTGSIVTVALVLAALGVWVFQPGGDLRRSIVRVILSDRATLGFVRLLVAVAALYALASIVVLITRGRWMRAVSASGIEVETAENSERALSELREELQRVRSDRDETARLLSRFFDG